jgi:hypothetical protein
VFLTDVLIFLTPQMDSVEKVACKMQDLLKTKPAGGAKIPPTKEDKEKTNKVQGSSSPKTTNTKKSTDKPGASPDSSTPSTTNTKKDAEKPGKAPDSSTANDKHDTNSPWITEEKVQQAQWIWKVVKLAANAAPVVKELVRGPILGGEADV